MTSPDNGAYGAGSDIVDFILGCTFEIWEEGQVGLIDRYYSEDCPVYSLSGLAHGSRAMIDATARHNVAYPNPVLLGDDVIWSGSPDTGFYSSHRVIRPPVLNKGPTLFGPATGRPVAALNIADCIVEDGVITREWLLRDTYATVVQLGFDPLSAAEKLAEEFSSAHRVWVEKEHRRLANVDNPGIEPRLPPPTSELQGFAQQVIAAAWLGDRRAVFTDAYASYATLHRSPIRRSIGRDEIAAHYASIRNGIDAEQVSVDHLAVQAHGSGGCNVAIRWSVTGTHRGELCSVAGTGKPVFVLGATHWRIIADRIVAEWTVFDEIAVLAQTI